MNDNPEVSKKYNGGSSKVLHKKYRDVEDIQVHHIPSVYAYKNFKGLSPDKGPSIGIDINDHKQTSSYKRGHRQDRFRMQQSKLLAQGYFMSAQEMEFKNSYLRCEPRFGCCPKRRISFLYNDPHKAGH